MSCSRILASLLLLVSPCTLASPALYLNQSLPLSPEKIQQPYHKVSVNTLSSAEELIAAFNNNGYLLTAVKQSNRLPSYYVENLPSDLNALPVSQKTSGFIRLLLPTIKAVNERILLIRDELSRLSTKPKSQWSEAEGRWVQTLSESYAIKSGEIDELLLHIDIIPVGMVLAQGIDESGWGTSHFAIAGNNLYGEHLPHDGGKFLTTPGGHVKVAAFSDLYQSTASYMHNLNTTRAYKELRLLRQQLRAQNKLTGYELVQSLKHYSTRGQAYVDNLRALIKHHHLDDFDQAKLNTNDSVFYSFSDGDKA
ncbi:glucosaminidase domain-containing protein [Shewanella schlegeliana]|uniref:Glucosaminidase domain-containing protein n=1 Tax=Shewanella schlegeliana TaxID=190308 RepID=A0ABS1T294_9GAMM|nr:glucosaminidase domain-containing protein [Shewanella schlegeliana]MBL4914345.1 glucosaminidase domain-containing protein [Shewanella schlegeliana]MCL1109432.1 glucosaminidase domain-containing protein [Shewanella schlegeliana]GIU32060.1 glucosaminidase [Shewanella schlegeliana]